MSIDYSEPKYKKGDKVEVRATSQSGRIEEVVVGIRRQDDKYLLKGNYYRNQDLLLIK